MGPGQNLNDCLGLERTLQKDRFLWQNPEVMMVNRKWRPGSIWGLFSFLVRSSR